MFGFGKKESTAKLRTQFMIPLQRKRADGTLFEFKVQVTGYFVGAGGKPAFTIGSVSADGTNIELSSFSQSEIADITKYALNVQYKKMIGQE
jgi:hypothetical protein